MNVGVLRLRRNILFIVGLMGLVVSGTWFLRDYEYEPLLALGAAVSALLADFLWVSVPQNKAKADTDCVPTRLYAKHKWLVTIVAILLIPLINFIFPKQESVSPKYDVAWYEPGEDGGLRLVDPAHVKMELDPGDIIRNQLKLPINLAVRNADNAPLKVVRIELIYDNSIQVLSTGRAKIDPTERVLVYEHIIGTLERVQEFTPLETVDVITVPFQFFVDRFVALTGDDVPHLATTILGEDVLRRRQIFFDFRIFCDGRPPVQGKINMHLASGLELILDMHDSERVDVSGEDRRIFREDQSRLDIIDQWRLPLQPSGKVVEYRMGKYKVSMRQYLSVDGRLRKLVVDEDASGEIDFILIDGNGDGHPERKYIFEKPWPMVPWPAEAAQ